MHQKFIFHSEKVFCCFFFLFVFLWLRIDKLGESIQEYVIFLIYHALGDFQMFTVHIQNNNENLPEILRVLQTVFETPSTPPSPSKAQTCRLTKGSAKSLSMEC